MHKALTPTACVTIHWLMKAANPIRVESSKAALMRRRRQILSDIGYVQTLIKIPASLHTRLRRLKAKHKMRGLEVVVSAMIRKAKRNYAIDKLTISQPPERAEPIKSFNIHIPREHYDYLVQIKNHYRGVTLSMAVETVAAHVSDLDPEPIQLSLIREDGL